MKGFSLLETIIYIGLLSVVLSSTVVFSLGLMQKVDVIDPRVRMEEKASLVLSELSNELARAESVNVSASFLGINNSLFTYVDDSSTIVVIDTKSDVVGLPGGDVSVNRLRISRGLDVDWLTDGDFNVTNWTVTEVRDSSSVLTGINVEFALELVGDHTGVMRDTTFDASTTISINGHTTEL